MGAWKGLELRVEDPHSNRHDGAVPVPQLSRASLTGLIPLSDEHSMSAESGMPSPKGKFTQNQ